jgi:N-acetylneuraminic acid mutarotase
VWKEEIYVFSGWNGTTSNDDFYKFNMNTKQWEVVVFGGLRPPPRRSACYVQYKNAMYIWGGYGVDEHVSSDVWKFDFGMAFSVLLAA